MLTKKKKKKVFLQLQVGGNHLYAKELGFHNMFGNNTLVLSEKEKRRCPRPKPTPNKLESNSLNGFFVQKLETPSITNGSCKKC